MTMKLRNLLLLLATTLAFVACKKTSEPATTPSDYRFDVVMTQAERITEDEGITFEQNQFMLMFTNEEQGQLSLLIQCEEYETSLSAGTYSYSRGSLIGCLFLTTDERSYTFAGGSVDVALTERVYTIDATLTDANGNKYHFTYEGEISNMIEEDNYFVNAELKSAARLLPEQKYEISEGDLGIAFTHNTYALGLVFTPEQGSEILNAGTYSVTLGNLKIEECVYANSMNPNEQYSFSGGEIKVEGDIDGYIFDIVLTDAEGRVFKFSYEGVVTCMMTRFENAECISRCEGYVDGPDAYNYVIKFGRYLESSIDNPLLICFQLCIYGQKVDKSAEGYYRVPNGKYTFDKENFAKSGTIYGDNSYSYVYINGTEVLLDDATLEVTDEDATLSATILRVNHGNTDEIEYYFRHEGDILASEGEEFKAQFSE